MTVALPQNEEARLAALAHYDIIDAPPETSLDEIVLLAAQIGQAPIALLSFLDAGQQRVKARFGFAHETLPRSQSFCAQTILQDTPLIITDVRHDEFFRAAPLDSSLRDIRFYAGVPLLTPAGQALGTLCVMDRFPRTIAPRARQALVLLARQVVHQLEIRRTAQEIYQEYSGWQQQEEKLTAERNALAARESYYRALFEENPAALYVHDPEGCIVSVNPALAALLGYTPRDLTGRNLSELLAPSWRRRAAAKTDAPQAGLVRVLTKTGETRLVSYRSAPLERPVSEPLIAGRLEDITQARQQERAWRRERNLAAAAATAKSKFLANMSHEIRTPMNGIVGMANLLADSELNRAQREYVDLLRDGADNLITYINDILDLSKIEAGMMSLERVDFDLAGVVENTVKIFAGRAHAKGLEMVTQIASDVPRLLRGDPGRLRQILNNLLSNAIKFTECGEIVVRVESRALPGGRVELQFTVSDTGVGIPADFLPRLYDSYTQAGQIAAWRHSSTGLGLAISKQLVELMGGFIQVESEVGRGSVFRFNVEMEQQPVFIANIVPPGDLRGLRVLVVDDNAASRHILRQQTTSWGMISREAESATAALDELNRAILEDRPFDVAVIDWEMPDMDGIELARRIKTETSLSSLPLILLSSFGWRGQAKVARAAGLSAYLTKPIRQSQLFECLVTVLGIYAGQDLAQPPAKLLVTRHNLKDYTPLAQTHRILLAEDNVVNQQVAVHQLYKLGYTADVVANGREALAALAQHNYDLLLMDCQMPEMDGYEAASEIRRREGGQRHTIIVAMTAHALPGDREQCLAAGMDDYLQKPIRHPELKEMLERWLMPPVAESTETVLPPAAEDAAPVVTVPESEEPQPLTPDTLLETPPPEPVADDAPNLPADYAESVSVAEAELTEEVAQATDLAETEASDDETVALDAEEIVFENEETVEVEAEIVEADAATPPQAEENPPTPGEIVPVDEETYDKQEEQEAPLLVEPALPEDVLPDAELTAEELTEDSAIAVEEPVEFEEPEEPTPDIAVATEEPVEFEEAEEPTPDITEVGAVPPVAGSPAPDEEPAEPAPVVEEMPDEPPTVTATDEQHSALTDEPPAIAATDEPFASVPPAAEISPAPDAPETSFFPQSAFRIPHSPENAPSISPAPDVPETSFLPHSAFRIPHSLGGPVPEPVIDLSVLARLLSRDGKLRPELAIELIDLFLQDAGNHVTTLQQAWAQRNTKALLQTAHGLKSSSASMGAKRLSVLCENFHRQVSYQQYAFAELVWAELLPELERVCQALRVERNRLAK